MITSRALLASEWNQAAIDSSARNILAASGEIDLIVQSKAAIVFVEVRYRHHNTFGSALESIDRKKQARVIKAAQHFLLVHPEFEYRAARFDVIGFAGDAAAPEMHWIENAFSA
ncbi:MAG: YraN family protein [Gammaproteobacteria bacterium]